jgi:hypothetical protein
MNIHLEQVLLSEPTLQDKKSARRPLIGDKQKMSRLEGCSLTFRTDWLLTSSRWRLELDNSQSQILYSLSNKKEGIRLSRCLFSINILPRQ